MENTQTSFETTEKMTAPMIQVKVKKYYNSPYFNFL